MRTFVVSLFLRGLMTAAFAGTAPPSAVAAADPLDPAAAVPAPVVPSSLSRYKRWADVEPTPWPQAQRTVQQIGGWRSYLREAQQPTSPPDAPASAASPASANGRAKP